MLKTPAMFPLGVVQSVLMLPGELRITERLVRENVKIGLYIRLLLGKKTLNFKWKGLYNHGQFYQKWLQHSNNFSWEEVKVRSLKIRAMSRQMHFQHW